MEEYNRLQEEKSLSRGETFNWQTATYGKMEYREDEDDCFTNFESEFPAIVLDDTSREALFWEPTVSPLNDNEINFRISDMDNDNDEIDIEQPSGDMSVIPLPNVINVDVGASAQGSNKLSETSHDTSNKFFNTETFIKKLNVNIVAFNYLNNGMLLNLIKNLYVSFGIPFDPKLFYKDGIKLGQV
ncbi:hypothetical protein Tco_0073507 [Tanacetum coccineum]